MTEEDKKKKEIQDDLVKNYRKRMDSSALRLSIKNHLRYTRAKDEFSATDYDKYMGLCYAVRDRMVERWSKTQQSYYNEDVKRLVKEAGFSCAFSVKPGINYTGQDLF
ncbi:hypothetical protein KJ959_01190, partial [bacterium]|nr:hypothetical protein [Candidatus Omnitrophota bacterium]MBU4122279.1 hypothetical protein [bacterium]